MGILGSIKNWLFGAPLPADNAPVEAQAFPIPVDSAPPVRYEKAPVIGISGGSSSSKSVAAMMSQIRSTGAEPVFLGEHADRIARNGGVDNAVARDLSRIDALVVMGNDGDIDPAKYGEARDKHTKVETDLARASYEEKALQSAMDAGMPVLGICGGLQRINVLGGGTLYQHVPDIVGDNHHMQGDLAPFVPVQAVELSEGSNLAAIGGKTQSIYTPRHGDLPPGVVMENSFHHQAVKKVRDDFRVSAVSDDGIIEAIEPKAGSRYAGQYLEAVQWHPEFGASDLGPKIAASVTEAARAYSRDKIKQVDARDLPSCRWTQAMTQRQQDAVLMR